VRLDEKVISCLGIIWFIHNLYFFSFSIPQFLIIRELYTFPLFHEFWFYWAAFIAWSNYSILKWFLFYFTHSQEYNTIAEHHLHRSSHNFGFEHHLTLYCLSSKSIEFVTLTYCGLIHTFAYNEGEKKNNYCHDRQRREPTSWFSPQSSFSSF
jgi:hypothetical protein